MANLTQLKMLEDLHGYLLIDKPAGIAFSAVMKSIKRKFNLVKVGHGGSLDAMASGLFILLINDANKFVDRVMGADRAYEGTMRFGIKTNTHDIHGEVIANTSAEFDAASVEKATAEFRGDIFQTEPRYCSIRKPGTADYEVADTGEHSQFLTHVYRFEVTENRFSVVGTKSLIVRTLANDFGEALGCGAALESLRRMKIGRFTVDKAVPFERILNTEIGDFASWVMPLSQALQ